MLRICNPIMMWFLAEIDSLKSLGIWDRNIQKNIEKLCKYFIVEYDEGGINLA